MSEYGENGFIPTVEDHTISGDTIILETIDPRESTNLVSVSDEDLTRVGDNLTEEQKEIMAMHERN